MSGVLEGMDGIAPADVAARWHARLMAPDCTLAEREKFEAWLRQSPENALAFEDTKALWASLDGLEEDKVIGPHAAAALAPDADHFMGQWSRATEGARRRAPHARPRAWWPLGAGIAAALAMVVVLWPGLKPDAPIQTYAASGMIESVLLPDGSSVRLDLETVIDAKFDSRRRDIDFRQGRAMFDVARDATRPFVVDAGVGTVTALGTRFQVQRRGDRVSVTLLEGAVGIATAGHGDARSIRLVPGQTAHYAPQTRSWTVDASDAAALTSWSQGFHVFGATPLRDAVAEINRYSDVKLVLSDPGMGDLALSGSFKLGDGRAVSEALPYALPVKAREQGGEIVISRR